MYASCHCDAVQLHTVTAACVARGMVGLPLVCTQFCRAETDRDDNLPQEAPMTVSSEPVSASPSTEPVADPPSTEQIVDSPQPQVMDDDGDSPSDIDDSNPDSLPRIDGPSACNCPCCANFDDAHQPKELEGSKTPHGQQTSYTRSIQVSWYEKHPWISVCTSSYKVFCQVCCSARSQDLVTFSKRYNSTFVEGGFSNWKKALQRFAEHEKSEMHREAVMKLVAKSSTVDVGTQLSRQRDAEQRNHRAMMLKVLECVRFLARQGLPFRGHHEDSAAFEGNLYQLLLLQAKDCPPLGSWLKKRDYISPDIINEIITICGQMILRQLLQDICAADVFALIADEATDISHNEQMCIAIRWVDSSYDIHEAALGLVQLPDTKALTLFNVIKDVLVRCSLPVASCIGQAYDGAANMSGIRNGVQALMKKEADHCLYVHCFAHSLNLCVQDVTRKCELLRNCMEFIFQLVQLIKFSPKRLNLFESVQKEITLTDGASDLSPSLRTLCPTRWTVRHSAINSILKNYQALMSTLDIIQQGHDEYAARGKGLLTQMESFDTFFSLKLAHLVFSAAEQFSTNLQAKDTTVAEGTRGARLLRAHYTSMRSEAAFSAFYQDVLKASSGLTDEPILPRPRRLPRRFDEGARPHHYTSPEEKYRQAYFEALDNADGEVEKRFDQSDLTFVRVVESLLLDAANGESVSEIPEAIAEYFREKIDLPRLKVQLLMLPDAVSTAFAGSAVSIRKVTNVRTIADTLNQSKIVKGMLSEVDKLLRAYLTFPVTSATAERSFSSLCRIKTFLRSSMTQQRLNNLFLLYVHSERTESLNLVSVAKDFVGANSRRMNYFGKFT